ncbi:DNA-3-methyladenine glycosylase 2 family protein [Serpentinicella sp. ANB-PHB4]|uniref:DNA-3-methyladenine glycosylase family protein n=1 Tax=Serpentinicella sp. ANB-PHB4 TaxID=3074076 RepID=UPI002858735D|nr:DNA-3-methyladenine glycosylase 2 family protein [Serpentinicella sp. ANB-PHB4]MDR5659057.1 DNA-3-methyladenine glycosylase 2 family protein [Serpentinicella sp. ANB-PHB4]
MQYFKYNEEAIEYLKKQDPKLATVIDRVGYIKREMKTDPFEALISSIISQQISTKAAQTVFNRFVNTVGEVNPKNVVVIDEGLIRECGISLRKIKYIKGIAEAVTTGLVDFNSFDHMQNQEIVNILTELDGVGTWTAEMLLIFSLNRLDVFSNKDLGIKKGLMELHQIETVKKEMYKQYKNLYSPYGSVASLYLWEVAAGK